MRHMPLLLAAAISALATLAQAEDQPKVDCDNAENQQDMNFCAEQDAEIADKALNQQYKKTMAWMKSSDPDNEAGMAAALQKSQRAWIVFRDSECTLSGKMAFGGTMAPMLESGCRARLTAERTKQLKDYVEGN